jgi:hypothetical protein
MLIFGLKFHKFLIDHLCWCAHSTDVQIDPEVLETNSLT